MLTHSMENVNVVPGRSYDLFHIVYKSGDYNQMQKHVYLQTLKLLPSPINLSDVEWTASGFIQILPD